MIWFKLFILREKTTQNPASASPDFYAAIFCLILCFHYWASCSSLQTPTCLSLRHFLGLPWLYSLLDSPYKFQYDVFLERFSLLPGCVTCPSTTKIVLSHSDESQMWVSFFSLRCSRTDATSICLGSLVCGTFIHSASVCWAGCV